MATIYRIKLLILKRTSLKSQIINLTNLVEREQYENSVLKLRIKRVTKLYHAYEEFNDELILLDLNDHHNDKFATIQEKFYALAGKIENILNPFKNSVNVGTSNNATPSHMSGMIACTKRRIKLSEASLPKFDGRYENWLSFKNSFLTMIDIQTELSDVEKLQYLKSALTGEAANKLKILAIESSNYNKA